MFRLAITSLAQVNKFFKKLKNRLLGHETHLTEEGSRKLEKKSFNYYISDFLVFIFAKCLITLSKSACPAMLDSMFNLARSTSRVCDIVERI